MKAQDGKLRLDQKYKVVGTDYHGKYSKDDPGFDLEGCENCGNLISNVVIVEGSEDHRIYRIGTDCAAVMTTIDSDELKQAEKEIRFKAKVAKWLVQKMESIVLVESEGVTLWYGFEYDFTPEKMQERVNRRREYSPDCKFDPFLENWRYRGVYDSRRELIERTGKPVYQSI